MTESPSEDREYAIFRKERRNGSVRLLPMVIPEEGAPVYTDYDTAVASADYFSRQLHQDVYVLEITDVLAYVGTSTHRPLSSRSRRRGRDIQLEPAQEPVAEPAPIPEPAPAPDTRPVPPWGTALSIPLSGVPTVISADHARHPPVTTTVIKNAGDRWGDDTDALTALAEQADPVAHSGGLLTGYDRVPPLLRRLEEAGISFRYVGESYHYRVDEVFDWWPTTGLWRDTRGQGSGGRGVETLIKRVQRRYTP